MFVHGGQFDELGGKGTLGKYKVERKNRQAGKGKDSFQTNAVNQPTAGEVTVTVTNFSLKKVLAQDADEMLT